MSLVQEKVQARLGLQERREPSRRQESSGCWTRWELWGLTRLTEGANTNSVAQSVVYK